MPDPFDIEMEPLKARWDEGRYGASFDALEVCVRYDRPLPPWLADAANAALRFMYAAGGSEGRGKRGGYRAQDRRYMIDWMRWATATQLLKHREILPELGYPATRQGVFDRTSDYLRGGFAQGSPDAVEKSFNREQRRRRGS